MSKQPVAWKRRILVPIWIIRICLMILVIIAFGLAIRISQHEDGNYSGLAAVIIFYLLIIAVLLMDILQILMFLRDNLTPASFLVMNTIQTAFWGGVLLMDLVYIGRNNTSAGGIGLVVALFLLFLALLIYAAVGFHRQRKQAKLGRYAPAHNPAMPAMHIPAPAPYSGPQVHHQSTAYHSPMHSPMHAGGDLGQHQPSYPQHGAAADYYTAQPTKPANMV